jgi:hypothetical protein
VLATSIEKSAEHAIPTHLSTPALTDADHVSPLFTDKYIFPFKTSAAIFVKSAVAATPHQFLTPALVLAVHVTPLSFDT